MYSDPDNSKFLLIQTPEPISSRLDNSIFIPNLISYVLFVLAKHFKLLTIQFLLTDIMNYLNDAKVEASFSNTCTLGLPAGFLEDLKMAVLA